MISARAGRVVRAVLAIFSALAFLAGLVHKFLTDLGVLQ